MCISTSNQIRKEVSNIEEQHILHLQELGFLDEAFGCVEYIHDALVNNDYSSAKTKISELQFLIEKLQEIEIKKARRAQLMEIINEMRKRGIQIDFVSRL
jgi:GH35 family endo-1,4-beta-xylanase